MSQYILELPDSLLEQAKKIATQKQISINLLKERAKRADINACRAVLAKIPDNPIDELDRIL
ncbi:hypothetical protein PN36_11360 [Candidatus Thiomargarita nelsonii]|uniref:Uncharacterized protein n=1 Tax=Candidatus Thiomargarita nelsonii TaxID=1003181 RepID=A0A0A6PBP9_9GAMM|nr:hypothetical protein PN36_11360 [Candidatus Thiomargarita nelsonii]